MDVIRYFLKFRTFVYLLISCILAVVFYTVIGRNVYRSLTPVLFTQLYLLRIMDDYFDYERDKETKKVKIKKEKLQILLGLAIALYLWLNFITYGLRSSCVVLIAALALAEEKFVFLQIFMAAFSAFCYLSIYKKLSDFGKAEVIFLAIIFAISLVFVFFKRRKKP